MSAALPRSSPPLAALRKPDHVASLVHGTTDSSPVDVQLGTLVVAFFRPASELLPCHVRVNHRGIRKTRSHLKFSLLWWLAGSSSSSILIAWGSCGAKCPNFQAYFTDHGKFQNKGIRPFFCATNFRRSSTFHLLCKVHGPGRKWSHSNLKNMGYCSSSSTAVGILSSLSSIRSTSLGCEHTFCIVFVCSKEEKNSARPERNRRRSFSSSCPMYGSVGFDSSGKPSFKSNICHTFVIRLQKAQWDFCSSKPARHIESFLLRLIHATEVTENTSASRNVVNDKLSHG